MSVRRNICHAIAKLPQNATPEEVANKLDSFCSSHHNDECDADDDGVTPLMVACDKNQGACLRYMMELYPDENLWGRPDATSADKCGANTALHHAAMLGCVQAIDSLVFMGDNDDNDDEISSWRLKTLLSKTNVHSDTPIMMACANNQVTFLDVLRERMEDKQVLLPLLLATNDDGETPLSLGFGHGHFQVVQCLLAAGVPATYEMVQDCKSKLKQIDALLGQFRVSNSDTYEAPDNMDHYQQQTNAKRCLVILELHLAQQARKSMEQLIQKENQQEEERKRQVEMKKKRRQAESQAAIPPKQHQDLDTVAPQKGSEKGMGKVWKEEQASSMIVELLTQPQFRTLLDGSLVKSVSGLSRSSPTVIVDEPLEELMKEVLNTKSADEMLRERLRAEPVLQPVPVQEDETYSYDDTNVDAVMDSLCLDASMLLLNSHGMAMNCSPSQLEAIEIILHKQVQSVQEARAIQERLRR